MIVAAIVPGAWIGVVVAEGDGLGQWTVLCAESVPLPTDVARLVLRAEHIATERTGRAGARNALIAETIDGALAAHDRSAADVGKWRRDVGAAHWARVAAACLDGFTNWPTTAHGVTREAGAMLLWWRAQAEQRTAPLSFVGPVRITPSADLSSVPTLVCAPTIPVSVSFQVGTVRAAIDPGSAWLAVVVARGDAPPLSLVAAETFEVGAMVPLAKPRTVTRSDGTTSQVTHRRSVTSEHVTTIASGVLALLQLHDVRRVVVEHVDHVHLAESKAHSSRMATDLVRSAWVEGAVSERLRAHGIDVATVASASWRARIAPRVADGSTADQRVDVAVRAGFVDWPRSNVHARDAAGLCLYDATPIPERKARQRVRSSGAKVKRRVTSARRNDPLDAFIDAAIARKAAVASGASGAGVD